MVKRTVKKELEQSRKRIKEENSKRDKYIFDSASESEEDEEPVETPSIFKYDEYYGIPSYAKLANSDEKYAVKRTGNQFYRVDSEQNDVYATRELENGERVPMFAKDVTGEPIIAKARKDKDSRRRKVYPRSTDPDYLFPESKGSQMYILIGKRQVYPTVGGRQFYAKNPMGSEYFAWRDYPGNYYYASTTNEHGQTVEYKPTDKDNNKIMLFTVNKEGELEKYQYPINKTTGVPIYEKDENGNEIYWKFGDIERYAIVNDLPVYAKNKDGEPIFALNEKNLPYYGFSVIEGMIYEYYPVSENFQTELYLQIDNIEIPAKKNSEFYYAKNLLNDEIYPRNYNIEK